MIDNSHTMIVEQSTMQLDSFMNKVPDTFGDIAFVFHQSEYPFKETKRINVQKEHFKAGCLANDRRPEGTTNGIFSIAVIFTPDEHNSPCKLIKLVHQGYDRPLIDTFTPRFDEKELYRSCFLIHQDRILLYTRYYIRLYD